MSPTQGSTNDVPDVIKAIINEYASSTRPILYYMIIPSLYSAFLIPVLIALFLYSTPQLRRSLIFLFVVADILSIICMGCISLYSQVSTCHHIAG
jgi:cytochrome bd-type quinol oxidase subunit 2